MARASGEMRLGDRRFGWRGPSTFCALFAGALIALNAVIAAGHDHIQHADEAIACALCVLADSHSIGASPQFVAAPAPSYVGATADVAAAGLGAARRARRSEPRGPPPAR